MFGASITSKKILASLRIVDGGQEDSIVLFGSFCVVVELNIDHIKRYGVKRYFCRYLGLSDTKLSRASSTHDPRGDAASIRLECRCPFFKTI